jgi:quinol monooxygenase YgiN
VMSFWICSTRLIAQLYGRKSTYRRWGDSSIKSVTKRSPRASDAQEEAIMSRLAIWAQLEAKPGKEKEVEEFLKSAQPLAEREAATLSWYAIKMGPGKYGIFDTFADENGRNAHLNGEIAKALFAKAKDLFSKPPDVAKPEVLAVKSAKA